MAAESAKFVKAKAPPASSVASDGSHNTVHPADVSGRFTKRRNILFVFLIGAYAALPWIPINGHPAVFLDVAERRFYLFGAAFNAQDIWLTFFLLSGLGFALFVITTVLGRIWCGYACPQTVFLEGIFRRIERWVEGPRNIRIRRNAAAMNRAKLVRKTIKHVLFFISAAVVAHIFMSYFVSIERLWGMVGAGPGAHPFAFGWIVVTTGVIYANFAWFREQMCLVICPYGRLQSLMTDYDTLVIGYDEGRGEPRGKKSDPDAGDCINCNRCVVVCPTGIDIRNGLQLDCIGCAACVDACDEVMTKIDRPTGLVRYDSLRGFDGDKRRYFRPRLLLYAALGLAGLVAATIAFRSHEKVDAKLLRIQGAPYVLEGKELRNSFELHVVNKGNSEITVTLRGEGPSNIRFILAEDSLTLAPGASRRVAVLALASLETAKASPIAVELEEPAGERRHWRASSKFLAPRR